MNILMINGTMRKSSTYVIGKMLVERVSLPGDSVRELFLPKDLPEFCRGCGLCILHGAEKCPDYLIYTKRILAAMEEADLLIFTTPTFVYHASGQMKAFLDHFAHQWMVHRPKKSMFSKQAVCISTAAGGGMKQAVRDITDSLQFWGVARIFTYSVAVRSTDWDHVDKKIKDRIDKSLYHLMDQIKHDRTQVRVSAKTKCLFRLMRVMHRRGIMTEADTRYWNEMGWLAKERPWDDEKKIQRRQEKKNREQEEREQREQQRAREQEEREQREQQRARGQEVPQQDRIETDRIETTENMGNPEMD